MNKNIKTDVIGELGIVIYLKSIRFLHSCPTTFLKHYLTPPTSSNNNSIDTSQQILSVSQLSTPIHFKHRKHDTKQSKQRSLLYGSRVTHMFAAYFILKKKKQRNRE